MTNPIARFLRRQEVTLPSAPVNLQPQLQAAGVTRPYLIVMTGRTGSTWLAAALAQLEGFGNPVEYFSDEALPHYWSYPKPQELSDVVVGMAEKYGDQGVFGFKTNPRRLFWLGEFVDLAATFPSASTAWIDMRRWNLVKQALSFVVAKKTGKWHQFKDQSEPVDPGAVEISDLDLWAAIIDIVAQEQAADHFYRQNDIVPLRIYYEELADSKALLLQRVARYIRPDWEGNCAATGDGTAKLNKDIYANREMGFVQRHAAKLNEICATRDKIDLVDLRRRVQGGVTR